VSDPGYKLVHEALAAGHRVTAVPGPSALLTALTASGLPTDAFFFAGFLPPKSAARRSRLEALARVPGTLLFYEAPGRLVDCLNDVAAVLGPRDAVVARELTKLNEEIRRGLPGDLATHFAATPPRGEIAIVVGPPRAAEASDDDIRSRLETALATETTRDAARLVAEAMGLPRARVYDLALTLKREGSRT
jgi:16S rRNA (cytidine1402-2'-O)-methyltransferase